VHRALQRWGNPSAAGFPPNAAPSLDFLGSGLQDHRLPYNARGTSAAQAGIVGWYDASDIMVVSQVPSTAAVANIAAAANPTSGTPLALVSATGAGATVLTAAAPAVFPASGVSLSAGIAIDGLPTTAAFGAAGAFTTGIYQRSTVVGRCVSVSGVASGAGGTVLLKGYDCYGFPLSQLVTVAAGANTVNTLKAFKVMTSVTPNFTDTHTLSVGTADVFGIGLLALSWGDVLVHWNNALLTANTGFVAADTTAPATTATGDVRGTYAVQSASDGTKRLVIRVTPSVGQILTNPTNGLFGQPQV
jgi:hypothetical protein